MTTVLIVTCDRCGQTVDADRRRLRVLSGSLRQRRPEIDLCRGCAAALLDTLSGAAPAPAEAAAEPTGRAPPRGPP